MKKKISANQNSPISMKTTDIKLYRNITIHILKKKQTDKSNRNWSGHQISPTVVSLKGRLSQKLQSKSTLSCEMVQIHSLFRHGFIKKP